MAKDGEPSTPPEFCYMLISVAGATPEKVVFSLDHQNCPKTCHNFATLCTASSTAKRPGKSNNHAINEPTYRGTEFHRVMPGFMIQGGDFENFDGTGGRSIYGGGTFPDESSVNKHDKEGVVSMANRGPNTNGSQFFVTLSKTPHLDGKHVAFAQVVQGMDAIRKAATVETEGTRPVPLQRIVVVDCGVGKGKEEATAQSSSSSDMDSSEEDRIRRKREHKKRKHKAKARKRDESDSYSSAERKHRKKHKRSRSEKHRKKKDRHRHHSKERKHRNERRRRSPSR